MQNSYLLALIELLQPQEIEEMGIFLKSTYFNNGTFQEEVQALFRLIAGKTDKNFEKEAVYAELFPGSPWVNGKLDKIMSELSNLVREFLLVRFYMGPERQFNQQLDWSAILRNRGFHTRYVKAFGRAEKMLVEIPEESFERYRQLLLLNLEKHDWESSINRSKGDLNIVNVINHLDIYYYAYRLEFLNRLLIQNKLTLLEAPEAEFLQERMEAPQRFQEEHILLMLTQKVYHLLYEGNKDPESFYALMDLLKTHESSIDHVALQQLYTYIRNICSILINEGEHSLYPVLHQIQRNNLERGYLYYNGKITATAFANVVRVAFRVGQFEWAYAVIEGHKRRIFGDNETYDYHRLILAEYFFATRQFEKALDILPPAFSEMTYHLIAKRMELKIYYELNSDLLSYKIDAFKMFISRASKTVLSEGVRERHANFVNILFQLSMSVPGDKARSALILKRIQEKKSVPERDWLIEKAQNLA